MNTDLLNFEIKGDERGLLIALEGQKNIPFDIKRVFYIYGSDSSIVRGKHANIKSKQILIAISGECKILLDNGKERTTILLDRPEVGLYVESNLWREMYDFSPNCVLMVLSDSYYDPAEYIREYDSFIKKVNSDV